MPQPDSWARDAVIYQIYPRSFADANGDGVGDLAGVTSRMDYLAALGVDALWLSPFYRSPMADGGYDVADYRDVDPVFGTLADFDAMLAAAHRHGLRVIIDIVPNHSSDQHRWFQEAREAAPGDPARARYLFRDVDGDQPPNNLRSVFGGSAWTTVDSQAYLHSFAPEQPDFDWEHPDVRAEFADVLRFWLDRGVDGFRIDVADALVKPPGLPDVPADDPRGEGDGPTRYRDREPVHEVYREWRALLDTYTPERIAVAEAWSPSPERLARYVRPDELHQAFNFRFLSTSWDVAAYRRVVDESLATTGAVGAPATWVLSNHDVVRHASRLGRVAGDTGGHAGGAGADDAPTDRALGLARARAATLLMLALPGSAYLYQGEELGLPEVFDLPDEARQDPTFHRTGGAQRGRDGCRVPLPWSGTAPPFGFGPPGAASPWLPQPADWAALSVAAQEGDPDSTLAMYRAALRLRRARGLGRGPLHWQSAPADDVLLFWRTPPVDTPHAETPHAETPPTDTQPPDPPTPEAGDGLVCATNLGPDPVRLPCDYGTPLLASGPVPDPTVVPAHTTVWWPAG